MKKLILLVVGVFTFHGCVDQQSSEVVFTMSNDTDKNVRVLAFNTMNYIGEVYDIPKQADEIIIEPNSSYKVTRYTGLDDNVGYAFYSRLAVDYIRIIFNDERIKVYTLAEAAGTPDISVFRGEGSNGDYRHIITEEDYNTAEVCDPDCETHGELPGK